MTLKELIIEKVGSVAVLADRMAMTPQNLYRKIRYPDTMTIHDVKVMANILESDVLTIVKACCPH